MAALPHDSSGPHRFRARRRTAAPSAFRSTVLARAGHRCELCGAMPAVEAQHVRPARRVVTALSDAGVALCRACHVRMN